MPAARKPRKHVDPYRDYSFRVKWDGRIVAGITKVSALKRTTDVVEYRDGNSGETLKLPGAIGFDAITMERGITRDTAFEAQFDAVVCVFGIFFRADMVEGALLPLKPTYSMPWRGNPTTGTQEIRDNRYI